MTDTPKDLHLAIWELLTPEEQNETGMQFVRPWGDPIEDDEDPYWVGEECGENIEHKTAHPAILDAAREVLDLALIAIHAPQHNVSMGWWWCAPSMGWAESEEDYPTRTECIYHALKWLREGEK